MDDLYALLAEIREIERMGTMKTDDSRVLLGLIRDLIDALIRDRTAGAE